MEDKIKRANIQIIDNYVKDSYIKIHKRNRENETELQLEMEVRMSPINKVDEERLEGHLILTESLKMYDKSNKELILELSVQMVGSFVGINLEEEQFLDMVKYNGTPTLSQFIRSYVVTMTSVGGMEPIRIPLINFKEFFNNDK